MKALYHLKNFSIARLFLFGMVCLLPLRLWAISEPDMTEGDRAIVKEALPLLQSAAENAWANKQTEKARGLLSQAETRFLTLQEPATRFYFLARVELYRGWLADKKKQAQSHWQESMDQAKKAVEIRPWSEGYRVLADAGAAWMTSRGFGGIIKLASKVKAWTDRAVELDGNNALALVISTQGQINSPAFAGGDPAAAAATLKKLLLRSDLDNIERFRAQVALVSAHRKLKEPEAASRLCRQAAGIFPGNPSVQECQ
ncbi:hypothetical protein P0082_11810 [Candidatus Haliotispira prima]|uniref:Tetratricopeptide repeat protein n=1 Tax=Candidatus Haliotispira prima TaxID=3034016 RepID=A0ABY8MIH0_9SPIO|nr:hypothetical protein P0082_11810 [Candidatus Haliotispira prima]